MEKYEDVTQDMFNSWKDHPVTKRFFSLLQSDSENLVDAMLNEDVVLSIGGQVEYAKLVGMKNALYKILTIQYNELNYGVSEDDY